MIAWNINDIYFLYIFEILHEGKVGQGMAFLSGRSQRKLLCPSSMQDSQFNKSLCLLITNLE